TAPGRTVSCAWTSRTATLPGKIAVSARVRSRTPMATSTSAANRAPSPWSRRAPPATRKKAVFSNLTAAVRTPGPTPSLRAAGDWTLMIADERPDMGCRGPEALGGTPVSLMVYVKDVDAVAGQAVAAGAKVQRPVTDQFYGDRSGTFGDPFGHVWTISTHKED